MSLTAKAKTGTYKGHVIDGNVAEYLGIPYVKPPKRWQRGEELDASDEIFEADKYGSTCWQHIFPEEWDAVPNMSEDCLTLNLWTGNDDKQKKPVMVWIHGGSYYTGGSNIECCNGVYCGDKFATDCPDIIYVNFNYRVNIFGMLDMSSIDKDNKYEDSINLATFDQIAALKWVHENIEAFGGDPDNITVFGQSAGGGSVSALCCLPQATAYFNKAIIQSAGLSDNSIRKKIGSEMAGSAMLEHLGVKTLEEAFALPAEELVQTAEWYFDECGGDNVAPFDSTWGVGIMPESPIEGIRQGSAKHVTLMSGSTCGEYSSWVAGLGNEEIRDLIMEGAPRGMTDEIVQRFAANYPERSKRNSLIELHMDSVLRAIQLCMVEAFVIGGSKAYNYYIDCIPKGSKYKPQHCFEIPYIVDKPNNFIYLDVESGEPCQGKKPIMKLVGELQGCWANFARYGDPSGEHIGVQWKPYTMENHETLVIGYDVKLMNGVRDKDMDIVMPLHCDGRKRY